MAEKLQRRIVASYNNAQLRNIKEQVTKLIMDNPSAKIDGASVERLIDQTVLKDSEKYRIKRGFELIVKLHTLGRDLTDARQVLLWQIGDSADLQVEWTFINKVRQPQIRRGYNF